MINQSLLADSVQSLVKSNRIGRPVFVRCVAAGGDDLWSLLLGLVAAARSWVGASLSRLHATGSADARQLTVTLQFSTGATALVSVATHGEPAVDVLVLGDHGAIYYDGLEGPPAGKSAGPLAAVEDAHALRAAIEAAIRSGQPQSVRGEGQR